MIFSNLRPPGWSDRRERIQVSFEDSKVVCVEQCGPFTDHEICAMIDTHDLHRDGVPTFYEFVQAMVDSQLGIDSPGDQ